MNLSIVIPLLNEEASLEELFVRIDTVCKANSLSYEIWFVDDGVPICHGASSKT